MMSSIYAGQTVVLQNGLNGYDGIRDTYLENSTTAPQGMADSLQTWCN
jgi:hypothetical protein